MRKILQYLGFRRPVETIPPVPPVPPAAPPAARRVGHVRFCPVFASAAWGAPHKTFYSASMQAHNVARVMRVEIDPASLELMSIVMLDKETAHPVGVEYGL